MVLFPTALKLEPLKRSLTLITALLLVVRLNSWASLCDLFTSPVTSGIPSAFPVSTECHSYTNWLPPLFSAQTQPPGPHLLCQEDH